MQDWTCISSMCGHHAVRIRRFCLLCLFTAGLAPSMSSTRFYHFSQRTRTVLCLRSYAHLSQAMVSQRPLINKVDDSKHMYVCSYVSLSGRCLQFCFLYCFRIWQSRCCPSFPDTDGAFRVLPVLSAGRRLGLLHHYQHGTDEASVRQSAKQGLTLKQVITAVEISPPTCLETQALWHSYLNCETVFAVYKVHKWPKITDNTNSWRLEQLEDILTQEIHEHFIAIN